MRGKIIKGIAGFYYVYAEDRVTYACKARGIFRKDSLKPLAGDDVEMTVTDPKDLEGNITVILPRKNALIRPAVANVDQALLFFAAREPDPNLQILDRFLVMMARQEIPVVICFNKADLASEAEKEHLQGIFRNTGYPVMAVSLHTKEGLSELQTLLKEKTTVVAGPSGAGKSSLTNLLQPEARMETGDVSKKLGRGRQTTRHAEIVPVDQDTYLVDTPGFTSLYITDLADTDLKNYYPEFAPYEGKCRFLGCRHLKEPECAVKEAVQEGAVSPERYENYKSLLQELAMQRRY